MRERHLFCNPCEIADPDDARQWLLTLQKETPLAIMCLLMEEIETTCEIVLPQNWIRV